MWITALLWQRGLCNLKKLWTMMCRATQNEQVIMKSSDKTCSTGEENGKLLQYYFCKNPISHMKRQKDPTLEDYPTQVRKCPMYFWKSRGQLLISPKRMKSLGQNRNDAQLWIYLVMKLKSDATNNDIEKESGILGPWIKVNWIWSSRRWQE